MLRESFLRADNEPKLASSNPARAVMAWARDESRSDARVMPGLH